MGRSGTRSTRKVIARFDRITRAICALFAAAGILCSAVAGTAPTPESGGVLYGTDAYGLPEGASFAGGAVRVLSFSEEFPDASDEALNVVSRMICKRDARLQERYGITLSVTSESVLTKNDRTAFLSELRSDVLGGICEYGIIAAPAEVMIPAAAEGLFVDILDTAYCRLPESDASAALSEAMINDRLYFCFGEFSQSYLSALVVLAASEKALSTYGVSADMLLSTVTDGSFTTEYLMRLGESIQQVTDYFITCTELQVTALFLGAGGKMIDLSSGTPTLSDSFRFDCPDFLSLLLSWRGKGSFSLGIYGWTPLSEDRTVFTLLSVSLALSAKNASDGGAYLLLPLPKSDENDSRYHTPIGSDAALYAIPSSLDLSVTSLSSAVLAFYLGYAAGTDPDAADGYYESFYGSCRDKQSKTAEVYDLILRGACFDYAYVVPSLFSNRFRSAVRGYLQSGGAEGLPAFVETVNGEISSEIAAFSESFRALIEKEWEK